MKPYCGWGASELCGIAMYILPKPQLIALTLRKTVKD